MGHISAQAVFQGGSNLPEDQFVNTFHFNYPGSYADGRVEIAARIADFYIVDPGVGTAIGEMMSPYVRRPFQVKTYDMTTPPPREPNVFDFTLPAVGAFQTHLPEEVCVCLSYEAAPPVTASRRGRIFVGPFTDQAGNAASTTVPTRVQGTLSSSLQDAATALMEAPVGWSIYSRKLGTLAPIVGGWIDDAFDTQRRRGPDPSARTLWPLP